MDGKENDFKKFCAFFSSFLKQFLNLNFKQNIIILSRIILEWKKHKQSENPRFDDKVNLGLKMKKYFLWKAVN